jgi:hypothetical protein
VLEYRYSFGSFDEVAGVQHFAEFSPPLIELEIFYFIKEIPFFHQK